MNDRSSGPATPVPIPAVTGGSLAADGSGPATAARDLTHAERRNIIIGLLLALLLGSLDQTIVAVALPRMGQELDGFSLIAWVVSGYLVASTVVTPIYGKLSDLFGRRLLLSIAIVVFLLASVACALAETMPQLIAARVLQGLGGGGLISLAQTIIADVVPLRERGRYQGYISGVYAVTSVLGPVVGGLFTHYLTWRWIFWINLPLGAAAFLVSRRALAHLPIPGVRRRIDYLGAALLVVAITGLLIPITRMGQGVAWNEPQNLELLIGALIVLAVCLWHEARTPEPIIPLDLFRNPLVARCLALVFLSFFQVVAIASLSPLRFEMVAGVKADAAALRLLPLTIAIPFGAFIAGRVMLATGRHKPLQVTGTAALPLILAGLAFTLPSHEVLSGALMAGVGLSLGITMPSSLVAVQNAVPRPQLGIATACTSFFRSLGGAVGVAVLSAVLLASMQSHGIDAARAGMGDVDEARATPAMALAPHEADAPFRLIFIIAASVAAVAFGFACAVPEKRLSDSV